MVGLGRVAPKHVYSLRVLNAAGFAVKAEATYQLPDGTTETKKLNVNSGSEVVFDQRLTQQGNARFTAHITKILVTNPSTQANAVLTEPMPGVLSPVKLYAVRIDPGLILTPMN